MPATATANPAVQLSPIVGLGLGGMSAFQNLFNEQSADRQAVRDTATQASADQLATQQTAGTTGAGLATTGATNLTTAGNKITSDALAYDKTAEGARMAADAKADVNAGVSNTQRQAQARLSQLGINPAGGRLGMVLADLGTQGALAGSVAANQARVQADEIGDRKLATAAQVGQAQTSAGNTLLNTGISAGTAGTNTITVPSTNARADANLLGAGIELGLKGLTTDAQLGLQNKNIDANLALGNKRLDMTQDQIDAENVSAIIDGIGTVFGKNKDGKSVWDIFGG